ncbi:di-trans,poly-cis-decaprenylcistransferase [Candidatus Woesearchaeota archaeon]|nr:di-trans,poly-cis-decaprenylcistransferase [Candidatus Woesearchaeota archaeon]|tara:strand:+ start:6552 stop:7274 length:723 start_codon:yes stop_codon:yes gene_type:complete
MSETEEQGHGKVPRHIAIIMDGNRRFSRKLMLKPWKGHEWGAKKIEDVLNWCKEYNITELTLYAFSVENFNRPKKEFDFLMKLFKDNFDKLKDDKRIYENEIRINILGRIWMFPKDVQEKMQQIMEKTKNHKKYTVNFAMAYGGRSEVVDAAKKIAEKVKEGKLDINQINEDTFSKNLYFDHEPDLIIRTGGEKRTSNFLAWQGAYSEYFFIEKVWPEFEKEDFVMAINEYSKRQRRFGK